MTEGLNILELEDRYGERGQTRSDYLRKKMIDAEQYVEAGQALIQLGRHIQRTFPKPNVEGSQYGEFETLRKLLPEWPGRYVDIGASDGVDCSNTYEFFKLGWHGLLIEPLPDILPALLLNRPTDIICPIAASDTDGYATLHKNRSVSSLDPNWWPEKENAIPVMTERLDTILKRYRTVDWSKTDMLSLDVEGHEAAVLRGINWETFKPKVVIIEWCRHSGEDLSGAWHPILEGQGYKIEAENRLNRIYRIA